MSSQKLAFLGLGAMGAAMAARLMDRGHQVTVYNRSRSKGEALAAAGAQVADTPAAAVGGVPVVFVSLADEAAVDQVLFGPDGAAGAMRPGALIIDTSTVSPAYAVAVAARLETAGLGRLEACVVGNPQHARTGELRVFVAGAEAYLDRARPLLEELGKQVVHVGAPGMAATVKLVFNVLLGVQLAGLAEAVSFGVDAGLDRDTLIELVRQSPFSSPVMSFRAPAFRERRYQPPSFRLSLMGKDLALAVDAAAAHGREIPVVAEAARRFQQAAAAGLGELDAAAIAELQERPAGPAVAVPTGRAAGAPR